MKIQMFDSENKKWLLLLVEQALGKAKGETLEKLEELKLSVESIQLDSIVKGIDKQKALDVQELIKNLEELNDSYSSTMGLGNLDIFEENKRLISGYMSRLSTLYGEFMVASDRMDTYLKKTLVTEIAARIQKESDKKVSHSQAVRLVELDPTYQLAVSKAQPIIDFYKKLKIKYNHFTTLWMSLSQTIKVASQEKIRTNGD